MPIESRIDESINTIIRTVSGKLSLIAIQDAFNSSLSMEEFKKDMHVIWDLREADATDLVTVDIPSIVNFMSINRDTRGTDYKIALVALKELVLGLSILFDSHKTDLPITIKAFTDMDDAFKWIKS
ncbi:MAG: hypothetical protein QM484_02180 [Woeseiaceae bacterium]